jgi:uncharacterized protein YkwD
MHPMWSRRYAIGLILGIAAGFPVGSSSIAAEDPPAPASDPEEPLSARMVELIEAHNRERAAEKKPPLAANPKLVAAARVQARDMAEHNMMSHEGTDGSKFYERIQRQGYTGLKMAENVAMAQKTVPEVMKAWMNSPPHKENILGDFSEIGVAREVTKQGVPCWCVTFAQSKPPEPRQDRDLASTEVVEGLNRARAKAEKPPFTVSPKLTEVARTMAVESAARWDLVDKKSAPEEPSAQDRLAAAGYRFTSLGQTEATNFLTSEEAVRSWLASAAHQPYFLGDFSEIGVGYATSQKGIPFWTVLVAQPSR